MLLEPFLKSLNAAEMKPNYIRTNSTNQLTTNEPTNQRPGHSPCLSPSTTAPSKARGIDTERHIPQPPPLNRNACLSGVENRRRVRRGGRQDVSTVLPQRRRLEGGGGGKRVGGGGGGWREGECKGGQGPS